MLAKTMLNNADGVDEEAIALSLMREDMLGAGADLCLYRIGAHHVLGHRPALGFAVMDAPF